MSGERNGVAATNALYFTELLAYLLSLNVYTFCRMGLGVPHQHGLCSSTSDDAELLPAKVLLCYCSYKSLSTDY